MDPQKHEFLKPALKTPKRVSILENFRLGESPNDRYANTKLQGSPLLKANYIKATRASQFLYMKNNKNLDPLLQVELNTNKYEVYRLPHLKKKKKFDYKKATENLTPIKEKINKPSKINSLITMSTHINNVDIKKNDKNKKLAPLTQNIDIRLCEENIFDEFYLEKYINMINIDQEVFYLGSSFLSIYLESIGNILSKKNNQTILRKNETNSLNSLSNSKISNFSLNMRYGNHYSNKNLINLSKLSLDSITTNNTNLTLINTNNKILTTNSDSKISLNNFSRSEISEKATIKSSLFGINFPLFTVEKMKENILTLKYQKPKFRFMRILLKTNLKVEMDLGFIEFEISEKRYLEIHKLYIIKVYRKMDIYESILENLFKKLFEFETTFKITKIFIKVLDRYESYKALLGKMGFSLNEKVKIKDEYVAYLLLKKKNEKK